MTEAPKPVDRVYAIRTVDRVCDILDLLVDGSKGMSLGQVAEVTELPKNTVFRYLATLEGRRYVERDEYGLYGPGSAFLPFLWHQVELLTRRARPRLEQVRDMVGETVNLGVLGGEGVTYLDIVESPRSVRWEARAGGRDGIHSTALGKAIAAQLPGGRVRDILTVAGMPRKTTATITDLQQYLDELACVRERGWAFDGSENEPDGCCVAVPLRSSRLPLAVSVSAPPSRLSMTRAEKIAAVLIDVTRQMIEELAEQPLQP